jgi:hypothetical protein
MKFEMRNGGLTNPFFILLSALVVGCLQSDVKDVERAPVDGPAASKEKTTAPQVIDPAILSDRLFGEAPMLAERVRSGDLPPVSERLPEHPLVVVPMEEIGRYGGTLRRALTGDIVQTPGVSKTLNENLMGYGAPFQTAFSTTSRNTTSSWTTGGWPCSESGRESNGLTGHHSRSMTFCSGITI